MNRFILVVTILFIQSLCNAQRLDIFQSQKTKILSEVNSLKAIQVSAGAAYTFLTDKLSYPTLTKTGKWELMLYRDSIFGTVPVRIFIPQNYSPKIAYPLILILDGGIGRSTFKDAYKDTTAEQDIFSDYFKNQNVIIARPYADREVKFNWSVNFFNEQNNQGKTNLTFNSLTQIIESLKSTLSVDDDKVFALGHSDGSDGAFALEVYQPSLFAGFVAYNSMLTNVFANDMYLRNTFNRPLYLVHSDLDNLRPIQQTRLIMHVLDSLKSQVHYTEYNGYQHYDKHLQRDLPHSALWIHQTSRNPFPKVITWETLSLKNNSCDWLKVLSIDSTNDKTHPPKELNVAVYNKRDKIYMNEPYYTIKPGALVKASFKNNVFQIETFRCKKIEILISPKMVDFDKPISIFVNGKEAFGRKLSFNKDFLLKKFTNSFDRKALWVNFVDLKIN